jgi:transposase
VEQVGQRTNSLLLVDFIPFSPKPYSIKPALLRELYLEKGLSCHQIATQLGISKTVIVGRLGAMGILEKKGRQNNPENYRCHEAPYGYRNQDGKLVPDKRELKICRLIVELRARKGWSLAKIVSELAKRGYTNRRGSTSWHHQSVTQIFNRWNGKL